MAHCYRCFYTSIKFEGGLQNMGHLQNDGFYCGIFIHVSVFGLEPLFSARTSSFPRGHPFSFLMECVQIPSHSLFFAVNTDWGVLVRLFHQKAAHVPLYASFMERWSHCAQPTAEGSISLRLETHRDCLGFYTGNPSLPMHSFVKCCVSGWRMAQWVRVFFAKLDDLSLTPEIHVLEKTNSCK